MLESWRKKNMFHFQWKFLVNSCVKNSNGKIELVTFQKASYALYAPKRCCNNRHFAFYLLAILYTKILCIKSLAYLKKLGIQLKNCPLVNLTFLKILLCENITRVGKNGHHAMMTEAADCFEDFSRYFCMIGMRLFISDR